MTLPTTTARDTALAAFAQRHAVVLVLQPDVCTRSFGVSPCLATGEACYNTIASCKYKSAYNKASREDSFTLRGARIPAGESLRPYIVSIKTIPMAIDIEAGLARRGMLEIVVADEPCSDVGYDPYINTRAAVAGGTYWSRWLARNKNYSGRPALLKRGLDVDPWDWNTFISERYIIEKIALNGDGTATITLKDPVKLADRQKIPAVTEGRLAAAIKKTEYAGAVLAATSNTIQLAPSASAFDAVYVGMEVYVTANTASGQRRTISVWDGATRTATLSAAWAVVPDTTSAVEVSALKITLESGQGALYADPGTSGKREYIQIGSEAIEYTAKAGDVLSWASSASRAAWGTTRADHKAQDAVQQGRAWHDTPVDTCINQILNEGAIDNALIDTVQLADEINDYLGAWVLVNAYIHKPEDASKLLADLLKSIGYVGYWLAQDQQVHIVSMLPRLGTPPVWNDTQHIKTIAVEYQDDLRITHSIAHLGKVDHSGSNTDDKNFDSHTGAADLAALSAAEYGDSRPDVFYSRWFSGDMIDDLNIVVQRRVQQRRDAPRAITVELNHKDYGPAPGEEVWIDSDRLVDFAGLNAVAKCIVTKLTDALNGLTVELRVMNWAERSAFIAPDTAGDYPFDSEYDHICQDDELMADGTPGYAII